MCVLGPTAALQATTQDKSRVEKALNYKPVQRDVDYDIPEENEIESCRLDKANEKYDHAGFVVYDPSGRLLRLFFDLNDDNQLDSWSYFKDGIEVYREVDTNSPADGRADEFHWLGSAGTRRGKDTDNNYSIDKWDLLSASELAEEVFQAVRTADSARFKKLLVDSSELKSLGLGEQNEKTVANKLREASSKFDSFVKSQKEIESQTRWTQFGSSRPNLVPAGMDDNKKDLIIFDHAAAVFENSGKYGQLSLGTIIEVEPNNWRLLEIPQLVGEGQVVSNGGLFYANAVAGEAPTQIADSGGPEAAEMVKLFEEYDALEEKAKTTSGAAKIAELEQQRAELLMKLALTSKEPEEKQNWMRQMADTVTSAFQTDRFPDGIEFLEKQVSKIKAEGLEDQIPYMQWRIIFARFSMGQSGDRRNRTQANERYIADLEKFADAYPSSSFAADALFQLGLNSEVTERDDLDKAIEWYKRCQKQFPNTVFGKKASGALTRLTSQGKPLSLAGTTLNGQKVDLQSSQFRDKIIVVHYWETWCDTCIDGFEELQRIGAKYKDKVEIVGANLDEDAEVVKQFLSKNRSVNWTQLHSPGGVDKSPLAIQLGVATLPMTILIDQRGNLVESNFPVDELDREIQRLLRRENGQANRSGTTR